MTTENEISLNTILTSDIKSIDKRIVVTTDDGIIIQSQGNTVTRISGLFNNGDKPKFDIHTVKGSLDDPKSLQPGDYGMNMSFTTYFEKNGHDIGKSLVSFVPNMDLGADQNENAPASHLNILVNAGDGKGDLYENYRVWRFNKSGSLETKIIQCFEQDADKISKIEPKNGMIIYNSEIDKFQGYANGTWVDLH